MKLTLDSHVKFNVESLLKTIFFPFQNEFEFCNLDKNAMTPIVVR